MVKGVLNSAGDGGAWRPLLGSQTALITPSPGRPFCYHTFYWDKPTGGQQGVALRYVVVDMRLNGGNGGIVERSGPLAYTAAARLTAVRHRNNRDFWILTRDETTRGFVALLLNPQGMSTAPVVSMSKQYDFANDLQVRPDGRQLAAGGIAVEGSPGTAYGSVCLYDFDNGTGLVTGEQLIRRVALHRYQLTGPDGQRPVASESVVSSTSFSPDGSKLYTTETSPYPIPAGSRRISDIWQYDLAQPTPAAIAASRFLVSDVPTPLPSRVDTVVSPYQLQLTPHGQVWASQFDLFVPFDYVTNRPTSYYSATIRWPNVAGSGCGFSRHGFVYRPLQRFAFFPNLITNMLYAPATLNHEQACPEDSVQFWAGSAGDPAGLRWDFGEPGSGAANEGRGQYVAHRYARSGTYPVRLTLADGRVLTETVTVAPLPGDFTHENIFTPNGDGLNDVFIPVREALPGGRLRVFGRWGQAVFSTTDPALRWDGAGAASGDYFYLLEYPDCRGQMQRRKGNLTLVR